MSRYVDEHRGRFGVEPICRTLGVSASAYYERASGRRSLRAENFELRRANEILKSASVFFAKELDEDRTR